MNQDKTITTSTLNASAALSNANRVLAPSKAFPGTSLGALTTPLRGFGPTTLFAGKVEQGRCRGDMMSKSRQTASYRMKEMCLIKSPSSENQRRWNRRRWKSEKV
ncbi:hypothetical protein N7517_007266 [Penicillium concentricum]|uniref:Uncharacterized protein n=1 Tax=Penicillium concentricum TaxID=293559 RepID=A0A9W9SBC2_9EURO|nr:uncharacterized protein N7517_007266 [Penicillium concentricum]KAJ5375260.1 hypothetical protein N7517_007266 [Penicillium concentricum]